MAVSNAITFILKLKGAAAFAGEAKKAERSLTGVERVQKGLKTAAGLAVAYVSVRKATSYLDGAVDSARAARVNAAQTAAVIKSTGGVANVSAKDVGKLAGQLRDLTGISAGQIRSGQNMLLTFTKVRNEVGEGNDVFNQATKASLNMSVAMKQDLKGSSILVGKALNDPIRGMASLRRVGVAFTKQQEAQVEAMVASGDTLGAQKVILAELETQFGGSAEAAATPAKKLDAQLARLKTTIGAKLLPIVDKGTVMMGKFVTWLNSGGDDVKVFVAGLAALATGFGVYKIITLARNAMVGLNVAMTANPIGIVIAAAAALAVGLVVLYKRSATFRNVVRTAGTIGLNAFNAVKRAAGWVVDKVQALIDKIKGAIDRFNDMRKTVTGWLPDAFVPGRARGGRVQPWERITLVGEQGPELVSLPAGSFVHPNGTGPAGGGQAITVEMPVYLDGREIARTVKQWTNFGDARS